MQVLLLRSSSSSSEDDESAHRFGAAAGSGCVAGFQSRNVSARIGGIKPGGRVPFGGVSVDMIEFSKKIRMVVLMVV